ncbi:hypothetical protein PAEPH01_1344 [Pancytospora epiphaga]|nr:hypothetical protein PAEPH01_1344 [Pancytospora epiphaga]
MFGFLSSRYVSTLGMIAISAKLLSLVACEDMKNADSDVQLLGELSVKGTKPDPKSTGPFERELEIKLSAKKDVKGTVFLMENAEPKSTGWTELAELDKDVEVKSKPSNPTKHKCKFSDKKHYCVRLRTSDDKSYYGAVYTYEKGDLTLTPTIDGKPVEKKKETSTLLYIILGVVAIIAVVILLAICLTK